VRGDVDGGVDAGEVAAGGFGFGEGGAGVVFVEEHLALEVGGLDEIAVDEGEMADAGAGEEAGGCCAGCADTDDGDVRMGEELLAGFAYAGKEDLAGVAVLVTDRVGDGEIGGVGGFVLICNRRSHKGQYTFVGLKSGQGRASCSEPGEGLLHL
jgi:hypothetical protein